MSRLKPIRPVVGALDLRVGHRHAVRAPDAPYAHKVQRTGLTGRPWRRKREQILARDLYLCQCEDCAKRVMRLPANEVDHVIEVADGGTDDDSNLRAMNAHCHALKTKREEARRRGGG